MEFAWESLEISVEEGMVEEELRRAEDAALPYGAVEAELFVPPLPLEQKVSLIMIRPGHEKKEMPYRFLQSSLLAGKQSPLRSFSVAPYTCTWLGFFSALVPSHDLLPAGGLSKTLNDGAGAFWTSSSALPEDFRRTNDLGILMGIE